MSELFSIQLQNRQQQGLSLIHIYRPYLASPCPENMPILSDLHQALLDQHLPEADRVCLLYTSLWTRTRQRHRRRNGREAERKRPIKSTGA